MCRGGATDTKLSRDHVLSTLARRPQRFALAAKGLLTEWRAGGGRQTHEVRWNSGDGLCWQKAFALSFSLSLSVFLGDRQVVPKEEVKDNVKNGGSPRSPACWRDPQRNSSLAEETRSVRSTGG